MTSLLELGLISSERVAGSSVIFNSTVVLAQDGGAVV